MAAFDWNPVHHLNSVNSVDDAKREWPWLAGTAGAILGVFAFAAYKYLKKSK